MTEFTERQRRALLALRERRVLIFADLPTFVGRGTMAELVAMGLVETVNAQTGMYSKHFGWRLRSKAASFDSIR